MGSVLGPCKKLAGQPACLIRFKWIWASMLQEVTRRENSAVRGSARPQDEMAAK